MKIEIEVKTNIITWYPERGRIPIEKEKGCPVIQRLPSIYCWCHYSA